MAGRQMDRLEEKYQRCLLPNMYIFCDFLWGRQRVNPRFLIVITTYRNTTPVDEQRQHCFDAEFHSVVDVALDQLRKLS